MKLSSNARIIALYARGILCLVCLVAPLALDAQDQVETAPASLCSRLKEGKVSAEARYRFEAFERDGAAFTAHAYAPTLSIARVYDKASFHGFSAFASG